MPSALEHCILNSTQYDLTINCGPSIIDHNPAYPIEYIARGFRSTAMKEGVIGNIANLMDKQHHQLEQLLEEYNGVFDDQPGLNKLYNCKFEVIKNVLFKSRPFSRRPVVKAELAQMLKWGVIERNSSPYSNPLFALARQTGRSAYTLTHDR